MSEKWESLIETSLRTAATDKSCGRYPNAFGLSLECLNFNKSQCSPLLWLTVSPRVICGHNQEPPPLVDQI